MFIVIKPANQALLRTERPLARVDAWFLISWFRNPPNGRD